MNPLIVAGLSITAFVAASFLSVAEARVPSGILASSSDPTRLASWIQEEQTDSTPDSTLDPTKEGSEEKNQDTDELFGDDPANPFSGQGSGSKQESDPPQESNPVTDQGSDTKSGVAPAEGSGEKGTATGADVDVAYSRFNDMIRELQANERNINNLIVNMPVEFADKRKAAQSQVESMRQRNRQILSDLFPTAIESFEKFPNTQPGVTNYLMQHLQMQINGKNFVDVPFNPVAALRAYQRLANGGVKESALSLLGYRVNFLLNDFEAARLLLLEAYNRGANVTQPAMDNLRQVTIAWRRELAFREADAKNEVPQVRFEMDFGDMVFELFEDNAPNTVANFISLVEAGFYNGLEFYQVTPTDVVVSGSPSNDGQGSPGYQIKCECNEENFRHHFTGTLSMYPSIPDSGGSRFLITKQPRPDFQGKLTVFGRVIEGLENLYKIQIVDKTRSIDSGVKPTVINRITVLRKRDHEYTPEKLLGTPAGVGK